MVRVARNHVAMTLVLKWNRCANSRHVSNDPRGVPSARQVLGQSYVTGAVTMHRAVAESYFHFARERDDVLTPWGVMPIAESSWLRLSKRYARCALQRRQVWVRLARVMCLGLGVTVESGRPFLAEGPRTFLGLLPLIFSRLE